MMMTLLTKFVLLFLLTLSSPIVTGFYFHNDANFDNFGRSVPISSSFSRRASNVYSDHYPNVAMFGNGLDSSLEDYDIDLEALEEPLPMDRVLTDITELFENLPKPLKIVAAPNFGSLLSKMNSIKTELDKMEEGIDHDVIDLGSVERYQEEEEVPRASPSPNARSDGGEENDYEEVLNYMDDMENRYGDEREAKRLDAMVNRPRISDTDVFESYLDRLVDKEDSQDAFIPSMPIPVYANMAEKSAGIPYSNRPLTDKEFFNKKIQGFKARLYPGASQEEFSLNEISAEEREDEAQFSESRENEEKDTTPESRKPQLKFPPDGYEGYHQSAEDGSGYRQKKNIYAGHRYSQDQGFGKPRQQNHVSPPSFNFKPFRPMTPPMPPKQNGKYQFPPPLPRQSGRNTGGGAREDQEKKTIIIRFKPPFQQQKQMTYGPQNFEQGFYSSNNNINHRPGMNTVASRRVQTSMQVQKDNPKSYAVNFKPTMGEVHVVPLKQYSSSPPGTIKDRIVASDDMPHYIPPPPSPPIRFPTSSSKSRRPETQHRPRSKNNKKTFRGNKIPPPPSPPQRKRKQNGRPSLQVKQFDTSPAPRAVQDRYSTTRSSSPSPERTPRYLDHSGQRRKLGFDTILEQLKAAPMPTPQGLVGSSTPLSSEREEEEEGADSKVLPPPRPTRMTMSSETGRLEARLPAPHSTPVRPTSGVRKEETTRMTEREEDNTSGPEFERTKFVPRPTFSTDMIPTSETMDSLRGPRMLDMDEAAGEEEIDTAKGGPKKTMSEEDRKSWMKQINQGFQTIVGKFAPMASGLSMMSSLMSSASS